MEFASQTFLFLVSLSAYFIFALFRLRLSVLILPLAFPAYLLSFKVGGVPFTLIEGFIYSGFLALISHLIFNKFFRNFLGIFNLNYVTLPQWVGGGLGWCRSLLKNHIWLPIAILLLAAVISAFIVPKEMFLIDGKTLFASQKIALGILKGWILAPILMLVLFYSVARGAQDLAKLLDFYVTSSVFLAMWGLYQVVGGNYVTADLRASGPFISANYLALYITPAVFYVFASLDQIIDFFALRLWSRIAVLAVLFLALLFTKSYAAITALFIAVFWYMYLLYIRKNSRGKAKKILYKLAPLPVIFLVGIFALLASLDPLKWQQLFQFAARGSSAVRLEVYQIAIRLIAEHPFFGIGLGQFPAFYQLEAPRILGHVPYEWNMLHPHNLFLAFWLNLGLIGLAVFIWILVLCAKKIWPLLKKFAGKATSSFDYFELIKITAFFMLFIMIFHGLFDTPFFKNDLALLFWLIVGVILSPLGKKNNAELRFKDS